MSEFHVYFSSKKERKKEQNTISFEKKTEILFIFGMSVSCKQSTNFIHYNKRMFHIWESFGVNPSNTPELTYKQTSRTVTHT